MSNLRVATWIHSLLMGQLQITLPLPLAEDEADDVEKLFALVMRRIRREIGEAQSAETDKVKEDRKP